MLDVTKRPHPEIFPKEGYFKSTLSTQKLHSVTEVLANDLMNVKNSTLEYGPNFVLQQRHCLLAERGLRDAKRFLWSSASWITFLLTNLMQPDLVSERQLQGYLDIFIGLKK